MKSVYDVIIRPIITEQSMESVADKTYVFEVAKDSNKIEIRKAIETIFGVKVKSVNTMNLDGKKKRRGTAVGKTAKTKKAIVQLTAESADIEIFEGL